MPIYEYACPNCQRVIQVQASLAEKEKGLRVSCPECGEKKLVRVFGSFAIGRGGERRGSGGCGPQGGPGCCA